MKTIPLGRRAVQALTAVALLCSAFPAALLNAEEIVERFDFSSRTLDDGSQTFDTLMRSPTGLLIYGAIRKPPGDGPFPGVLMIHGGFGGNFAATRGTLSTTPADALVAAGYALLSTDYRAKDWVTEYEDVVAAYEYLKRLPYVRPDAIAVIGGSHGGKLAFELATRVDIQAAIPCAGLHDLGALYEHCGSAPYHQRKLPPGRVSVGNTYMQQIARQLGGTPSEAPDRYRSASPMSRADQLRCPVLLVHGEQDASVPVSFTKSLAATLEKDGKTVETFFPPQGPHGFYWGSSAQGEFGVPYDPAENQEFLARLLPFLERYLMPRNE